MSATAPRLRLAAAVVAACACLPCAAAEEASAWRLNGYGTLGLARTDAPPGWSFTRDLSQPAQPGNPQTWLDTRLGLQLNWQASREVELVAQGVLRKQDRDARAQQQLDWAFAAWRPDSQWTLRLGRTSPDAFLLADYRNVGYAFPWARPSVEMYGFVAFQSLDGLDVARRWRSGEADWKLKLGVGRNDTQQASFGNDPTGARIPGSRLKTRQLLLGTLTREQDGLTLKATFAEAHAGVPNMQALAPVTDGLQQLAAAGVPGVSAEAAALAGALDLSRFVTRYVAVGAQYEHQRWQLMAELSRIGGDVQGTNGLRGYVSAAYRTGEFTPYVMLGRALPAHAATAAPLSWGVTLAPVLGDAAAAQAVALGSAAAAVANHFRNDQQSLTLGLRWDFTSQAAFKLQADRYVVAPAGAAAWPGSSGFDGGRATVLSANVDFVF